MRITSKQMLEKFMPRWEEGRKDASSLVRWGIDGARALPTESPGAQRQISHLQNIILNLVALTGNPTTINWKSSFPFYWQVSICLKPALDSFEL